MMTKVVVVEITPTDAERAQERLAQESLTQAVVSLCEQGFVVVNDVVAHDHLNFLRERMEEDLKQLREVPEVPHNFVWGNIQQDPPPLPQYVFRDVVANPFVCQITREALGPNAFNSSLSGNTNVPGSGLQPVHVDLGQLWPSLPFAHPASHLVVNLALDDTTADNGAIELWPGTHLDTRRVIGEDLRLTEKEVEERRRRVPPVLGMTRRGAFLIRDMRLWHRGRPNTTGCTRFMIAMVHKVGWFRRTSHGDLDQRCAPVFEGCPIENEIPLVEHPSDHIGRNHRYEYDGPN
ncbi:MAG: phytanoyl-CoA dioxygenase family protein [Candidatus Latescibacterota bacterium]|nr:phytanoyl-CoA dioxygenase family protein [Candidatus Latescibacterota bacterium]